MFEKLIAIAVILVALGNFSLLALRWSDRRQLREGLERNRRIAAELSRSSREAAAQLVSAVDRKIEVLQEAFDVYREEQAAKQRQAHAQLMLTDYKLSDCWAERIADRDKLTDEIKTLRDGFNAYREAHASSHDRIDVELLMGGQPEADDGEIYAILADLGRRLDEIEGAATESFEAETRASNEFAAGVQNILGYSFAPTAGEV